MLKSSLHTKTENAEILLTFIEKLKGVNAAIVKPLKKLGIHTLYDLLFHIPFRYDDFSHKMPIVGLTAGSVATVEGIVMRVEIVRTWKKRMQIIEAIISDKSGSVRAIWFNQPFIMKNLHEGSQVSISGKVTLDGGSFVFQNPAYELTQRKDGATTTHTGRLVPVYRETAGITSRWLRYLIKNALAHCVRITDPIPRDILRRRNLLPLHSAISAIHFPESGAAVAEAKKRLAFEELFFLQLRAQKARMAIKKMAAPALLLHLPVIKEFVSSLPFSLTNAQRRAAWEILQDMEKPFPMNRLLEGDVGSGKTVVAAIAALNTAKNGWQTALMAPTEILALQHFAVCAKLFALFKLDTGLLTGAHAIIYDGELAVDRKMKKRDFVRIVAEGKVPIVVGTHALISKGIAFQNIGLVILDEQHRFGVGQRAALQRSQGSGIRNCEKSKECVIPHLLSMTATPIPRTLTMALYGDLDISLLNEMPKERKKVITRIVLPYERGAAYAFIRKQVREGRQVFVICPRIETAGRNEISPADTRLFVLAEVKTVKEEYAKLSADIFPDLRVAMMHGKMKAKEKEDAMKKFKNGDTDILVSTSVVEIGIDVPNASIMLIEGADRFGLAQLHQFRGRVGRGAHQSYCLLFSSDADQQTNSRLQALLTFHSGFELAERDLVLRGPGDFLGTRQSGIPDLVMASLADAELIKISREEAVRILTDDPHLTAHPALQRYLEERAVKAHLE